MNLREAASLIGVDPKTVWDWHRAGLIEGELECGKLELLDADVHACAARQQADPSWRRRVAGTACSTARVVDRYNAGGRLSDIAEDCGVSIYAIRNRIRRARQRGEVSRRRKMKGQP